MLISTTCCCDDSSPPFSSSSGSYSSSLKGERVGNQSSAAAVKICPDIVVAAMARIYWQLSSDDESEWTSLPVISSHPQPLHSQPGLTTNAFSLLLPHLLHLFSSCHYNPHCWNCFISPLALKKCPTPLQSLPRLLDGSRLEASPFVRCNS